MKVLLLNPPSERNFKISKTSRWPEHTKSGTLYYPFWLAYATGVLMKSGHETLLIDAIAERFNFTETINKINEFDPDLTVIETSLPTVTNDMKFIEALKRVVDTKTVVVGTFASVLPEEIFKMSQYVDFVARKEYEYTILDLVNALEHDEETKYLLGLSFKSDDRIYHNPDRPLTQDLDSIPFVSEVYKKFLNIYNYRYSFALHPMIQVWSSRGCPNYCTFCQLPQSFLSRTFRARTPENVVAELEWISENLPHVKEVFFEDDTFTVDKERAIKICNLIKEKRLNISWSTNCRVDLSYELMKKMKEAGCRLIVFGYESGNQDILNKIKKGATLEQAERVTRYAKKLGIRVFGCFMVGLPGDTRETIEQTFQFAKKLNPDMAFFQQAVPFPGTEFYDWCKENGYLTAKSWDDWLDENGQLASIVSYPHLSNTEIKKLRDECTVRFITSPKNMIQTITKNLRPSEMIRVATAAKDFASYFIKRNNKS